MEGVGACGDIETSIGEGSCACGDIDTGVSEGLVLVVR